MIAKRLVILAVFSALISALTGCEVVHSTHQVNVNWAHSQDTIKSIGVLEFEWKPPELQLDSGWSSVHISDAGAAVSDMVASELMTMGRYAVRERADLRRVLEEHKLQLSDLVARGDYCLIGRIAGVDAVVVGRVLMATAVATHVSAHAEASYTCRAVATRSGDILWSMGGEKTVDSTTKVGPLWLRTLTRELVQELQKKLENPPPKHLGK